MIKISIQEYKKTNQTLTKLYKTMREEEDNMISSIRIMEPNWVGTPKENFMQFFNNQFYKDGNYYETMELIRRTSETMNSYYPMLVEIAYRIENMGEHLHRDDYYELPNRDFANVEPNYYNQGKVYFDDSALSALNRNVEDAIEYANEAKKEYLEAIEMVSGIINLSESATNIEAGYRNVERLSNFKHEINMIANKVNVFTEGFSSKCNAYVSECDTLDEIPKKEDLEILFNKSSLSVDEISLIARQFELLGNKVSNAQDSSECEKEIELLEMMIPYLFEKGYDSWQTHTLFTPKADLINDIMTYCELEDGDSFIINLLKKLSDKNISVFNNDMTSKLLTNIELTDGLFCAVISFKIDNKHADDKNVNEFTFGVTDYNHTVKYIESKSDSFYQETLSKGYLKDNLYYMYQQLEKPNDIAFLDNLLGGDYKSAFGIKSKDDSVLKKALICPEELSSTVLADVADYAVRLAQMEGDNYQSLTNFANSLLASEDYINVENGSTKKWLKVLKAYTETEAVEYALITGSAISEKQVQKELFDQIEQKGRNYTDMIGFWASMVEALNCDRESISKHDLNTGEETFIESIRNRCNIIYSNQFAKIKIKKGNILTAPVKVSEIKEENKSFSYQMYAYTTDSSGNEDILKIRDEEVRYNISINRTSGVYNNLAVKSLTEAYNEYVMCKKKKEEAVYKGVQNTINIICPEIGVVLTNINDADKFLNSKDEYEYISNGKKLVMKSSKVKGEIKKIDENGADRINSFVDILGNINSYCKATEEMNQNISDIMEENILVSFGNTVYSMDDLGKRVYSNGIYDPFMVASICELNEKGIVKVAEEMGDNDYSELRGHKLKDEIQKTNIYHNYVNEGNPRLSQIDEVIDIILNGSSDKSLLDYDNTVLAEAKACINQGIAETINQESASIDEIIMDMRNKYE